MTGFAVRISCMLSALYIQNSANIVIVPFSERVSAYFSRVNISLFTDRPTDRQTDRQTENAITNPLLCMRARGNKLICMIPGPALPDPTLKYRELVRGHAHQRLVALEFPNCAITA